MSAIHEVFSFSWGDESILVFTMVFAIVAVLLRYRRDDRSSLINTLGFFLVCTVGLLVAGVLYVFDFARAGSVLHEVFLIGAGIAVIRLWGQLVFRVLLPLAKLSPPRIAEDFFVIIAYLAWGMVRLRYAGLELGGILATSAMITAVVAFSMQDTLGNILGGLALQLDNSIGIGDWINVDDITGRVVDIRWRSTLIETRNWETVVIPNSQLMKNKFLVLGRRTDQPMQWRRWVWFHVGMEVSPTKVISVVENAILETDIVNVANNPPANCILMDMDIKGYARYALRYWLTDLAADDPTDAILRWHIITALHRADIRLAVEESNVHITKENEKYEENLHQREILMRIKTLHKVELFSQMSDEELKKIAERLRYSPFARGNIITKQGDDRSHWLYIVVSGEAEVYLEMPNGGRRMLSVLRKGSFFGEMGLMTGAPRSASVMAKTDVECYRLDKDVFEDIIHERPTIAEEITHLLVKRQAQLDTAKLDIDKELLPDNSVQQHNEILSTIKRFFSLTI